ncbi:bifunctional (p)ppGpp synthetase/guanosine-3',5'-bis(diphosphate) 3'-pyrophosphohydrolase [Crocosphaera sp. UHCC 0190]|uniref:RelA/SpoT family protein n=1 Tax=Crocosphaera sp. UHCC 0190 TaxID=3110246 RepID=UPI002B1F6C4D|nr:bifunctional (p)ppGpp synthetase/guanosine-3',5'-bis(diphosphate) 3'-pyrophosphohydrolase [Crocosphaera sp. UHCC 0190]MEA5511170.1 bifunctional (p)ppGpp synthetase/guanosine-3',5'-bis(diphosphate) 3'-pyrophosphohydrolase [Crocosphaera sp. UHCC 0190]
MNAVTLPDPKPDSKPVELILPDWLSQCLIEYQTNQSSQDLGLICRAFNFAYQLHEGQYRKSGEPYIAHPVSVAGILRDLGGDKAMIAAGFLHDVVEDTEVTVEEIEERFGQEVRLLVEGVTKLSKFNFSSKTEQQAENFRRMFLAMAQDIRVIVVKLADRLHNMRTLEALNPDKQKRIALETREIFAPLANRLGIWRLKWELEDLSFKYLEADAYREVQNHVSEKRADRETRIETVKSILQQRLQEIGIHVIELQGRPKHLYGIYYKMQRQHKGFHEIYDIAALRIIVESNEECYRALAIVHDAFRPIPGRFKDYIGLPKPNRYQSLHTTVVGLNGRPLEIQIRTIEMHHIAEYGIAAHWKYKETGGSDQILSQEDEKFTWLRQLLEWQKDLKDAQEYVDNLKDNLFDDDVYVFTPNGDVVSLSRGATAVDFAYRIHTEVGNHMKGARINGKWSVLDKPLHNGDIVEIITQKNSHPSLDWLNFVVTPTARNRIRQWYKRSRREENVSRGREMLEKELGKSGLDALLKSDPMQAVAERCNYQAVEDLLAALGYGEITLNQVVNRVREATVKAQQGDVSAITLPTASPSPLCPTKPNKSPIVGVEGLVYHIAGCCHPLPGEPIMGVVTRGARGISIHAQGCSNVESVPGERLIPVRWNITDDKGCLPTYPVDISIEAIDRVGVLKDILSRVSDHHVNVRNAGVRTSRNKPAMINLRIDIRDRQQLECLINNIRNMSDILNIHRVNGVEF